MNKVIVHCEPFCLKHLFIYLHEDLVKGQQDKLLCLRFVSTHTRASALGSRFVRFVTRLALPSALRTFEYMC